jgi:hypothetical protein
MQAFLPQLYWHILHAMTEVLRMKMLVWRKQKTHSGLATATCCKTRCAHVPELVSDGGKVSLGICTSIVQAINHLACLQLLQQESRQFEDISEPEKAPSQMYYAWQLKLAYPL